MPPPPIPPFKKNYQPLRLACTEDKFDPKRKRSEGRSLRSKVGGVVAHTGNPLSKETNKSEDNNWKRDISRVYSSELVLLLPTKTFWQASVDAELPRTLLRNLFCIEIFDCAQEVNRSLRVCFINCIY